jgi:hypothetical protein
MGNALLAIIMTIWPWIFFGVLKRLGGLQLNRASTIIVQENPKDVAFFVTAISGISSLVLSSLHSTVVTKIAVKCVLKCMTLSFISFFVALKDQKLGLPAPWSQVRRDLFPILVMYTGVFVFATPAFTALLTPAPFKRNVSLTGTELDFTSNAIDCINWFNDNNLSDTCDWIVSLRRLYAKADPDLRLWVSHRHTMVRGTPTALMRINWWTF